MLPALEFIEHSVGQLLVLGVRAIVLSLLLSKLFLSAPLAWGCQLGGYVYARDDMISPPRAALIPTKQALQADSAAAAAHRLLFAGGPRGHT